MTWAVEYLWRDGTWRVAPGRFFYEAARAYGKAAHPSGWRVVKG